MTQQGATTELGQPSWDICKKVGMQYKGNQDKDKLTESNETLYSSLNGSIKKQYIMGQIKQKWWLIKRKHER